MLKSTLIALTLVSTSASAASAHMPTGGFIPQYVLDHIAKAKAEAEAKAKEEAKENAFVCEDVDGNFKFDEASLTLTVGDRVLNLDCEAGEPAQHPDQGALRLSCVEDRAGDGRYSVEVYSLGIIPVTLAEVSIGQMFPLPSKNCKHFLAACKTALNHSY